MFEWDETKRAKNLEKHGLDFIEVWRVFDGRPTLTATANHPVEPRYITISAIEGRFYSVVWTWRGAVRRIISWRRARDVEERAYRQAYS